MVKPITEDVDVVIKVYTGGDYVALYAQQSATLTRSRAVHELPHKQDGGETYRLSGRRDWKLDCDALFYVTDGDEYTEAWDALIDAHESDTEAGSNVEVQVSYPSGKTATGYAKITDLPESFPDGPATIKASFVANGPLVRA
jgi:hypothetical protein